MLTRIITGVIGIIAAVGIITKGGMLLMRLLLFWLLWLGTNTTRWWRTRAIMPTR